MFDCQQRYEKDDYHCPSLTPRAMLEVLMRDPETIETELMQISAIADDSMKLEEIVAWCASHPDEVPFAIHHMMTRSRRPAKEAT